MNEPGDLLPYHDDATDERVTAPISELLFPSPLLARRYVYTTTGVLTHFPSFANGTIITREVEVYLDETRNVIAPVAEAITQSRTFSPTPGVTLTQEVVIPLPVTSTTSITPTTTPQPALVTSGIAPANQIIVTCRWNPALRWSDGITVTASDSLFAYEVARHSSDHPHLASRLQMIHHYEVVDTHTSRLYLKPGLFQLPNSQEVFVDFSALHPCWTPLPRHILGQGGTIPSFSQIQSSAYGWMPTGYGPYLVERRDHHGITLKRNPFFPQVERWPRDVSFVFVPNASQLREMVVEGSVDVAEIERYEPDLFPTLATAEAGGKVIVQYHPSPIWEHVAMNLDMHLFQDIRVRRAIAYGTNRERMTETLLHGAVAPLASWIVPEHWAAANPDHLTRYPYQPEQSRQLLDEAGVRDADGDGFRELSNGTPLTITLITPRDSPLRDRIAAMFQNDMAAIGLRIAIVRLPSQEFYSPDGPLFRRKFELALFAWMATPDPGGVALWSCRAVPSEVNHWTGNNLPGWCFREADRAIRTAATAWNYQERLQAYLRQQQLFTQELPALPLFQRVVITIHHPNLRGIQPDPTAPLTWNIAAWSRRDHGEQ